MHRRRRARRRLSHLKDKERHRAGGVDKLWAEKVKHQAVEMVMFWVEVVILWVEVVMLWAEMDKMLLRWIWTYPWRRRKEFLVRLSAARQLLLGSENTMRPDINIELLSYQIVVANVIEKKMTEEMTTGYAEMQKEMRLWQ